MNKLQIILSLVIIYLLPTYGKAQAYVPLVVDSTHWFLEKKPYYPSPPPYWYAESYLLGDTTVSSINYKKVFNRRELANSYKNMVSSYSLTALIREDTLSRKVYGILLQNPQSQCPLNQEVLLYDFSIQVGDTLKQNDYCLLVYDGILSGIIQNNYWINTMEYTLSVTNGGVYEGIGSYYGLLEPIFSSVSGPQFIMVDYCRGGLSNCKFYNVGIDSPSTENDLKIYPNPILDYFIVSSNKNYDFNYQIISINGQVIKKGKDKSNSKIDVNIDNGIYFIRINSPNQKTNIIKKIIKTK